MSAQSIHKEITNWMATFDVVPSDWETVIWDYIEKEYTKEDADTFTPEVMKLFGV